MLVAVAALLGNIPDFHSRFQQKLSGCFDPDVRQQIDKRASSLFFHQRAQIVRTDPDHAADLG